jgi:hypothetical protein
VCYTRKTKVALAVKFQVTRKPTQAETVEIKGTASFDGAPLEWTGSVTVGPGDNEVTASGMTSNADLPDKVACYDTTSITWTHNPANTGWSGAGTSDHLFYLVLGNPTGTPAYWTLLDISCRAAHGETTEAGVIAKAYDPFKGRSLTRKRDGRGLTYWNPNTTTCTNTQQLLASADGSGQCGSWAEFLIDMYKCHGITSADKVVIIHTLATRSTTGFLVKNWTFSGAGSRPAPFTHKMGTECVEQPGIPGQRNPNPPPAFYNHFIVISGGTFYDPSYGSNPVTTQSVWENGAIDGLFSGGYCGYPKSAHSATNLLEFYNLRTGARI